MMCKRATGRIIALAVLIVILARPGDAQDIAPLADHHQHLFSPAVVAAGETTKPITVDDLISHLDAAGIRRAAVLSLAYILGVPNGTSPDEYDKVKAENDWTSRQVTRFPDRLVGFCSLNPLKEYAFDELARCAKDERLRRGLKLHFANSIQIAHLAGAGGYSDPLVDAALAVFVDAIGKGDPRTKQLWFDVTTVALPTATADQRKLLATRIRQLGVERVLYGSDATAGNNLPPREGWAAFQQLPLTDAEFRTIASNVPTYMR